jgi:iron complex outermembrane receptor protein
MSMGKLVSIRSMLHASVAAISAFAAAPLLAQTQLAANAPAADGGALSPVLQEVIVTGSRIPQPNLTSASPIQVVTATEIRQQGFTDMSNLLNTLPQNFQSGATDLSNNSNPLLAAGGITTADLRGIGPQRTLVLVDGKRLGSGDPNTLNPNPAPDLDQIPVSLVERVDVVTGGASAVYGSDAIAGVVNFIMKKNFEGIQVDGQLGVFQHSNHSTSMQQIATQDGFATNTSSVHDGQSKDFSIVMGSNIADGKGNVTAYLEYRHQEPVYAPSRDFAACELVTNFTDSGQQLPNHCIGSPNSNYFAVGNNVYSVVGNQLLPSPQAGSSPPASFNSNTYITLQRQDQRYNAGFMAHVDVNEHFKPYADFFFMNDRTTTYVAPSGLFEPGANPLNGSVGGQELVNCSNPLLSAQEVGILCGPGGTVVNGNAVVDIGRRNIEGGPRIALFDHNSYRGVAGTQGEIVQGWSYDAYAQYYYTTLFNSNSNFLDYSKVNNALQVTTDPATGKPVCISGSPCVPYNIWTQGGVTPDQTAYLTSPGTAFGSVTERIIHGDITGDLGQYGVKSPFAEDGVGINFGYEHRSDFLAWDPDEGELAGNLAGFSGAVVPIHSGYSVSEAFFEGRLPIAQEKRFVKDLSFDTGYRYSKYSTDAGHTNAYKFELQYAPIDDVRLRTSFERAIRAPNIIELFTPPAYGQQGFLGTDPCAGANPTASLTECQHTGVTAAQYGNIPQCAAKQCGQINGGNTALQPEQANTYTVGMTLTPNMLPGFSGSVDYFNIDLKNQIGTVPGAYLFNQCLTTGDPGFCGNVVRNHVTGALTGASVAGGGYIVQTSQNIAESTFDGIDVQLAYKYTLPGAWGSLLSTLNGSYLLKTTVTPAPGQHTFDCAGLFGPNCNQTVFPRWRHNMRVSWETSFHAVFSAQWRFISKVGVDNNDPDPSLFGGSQGQADIFNKGLPNISYLDLSAIYEITPGISIRAGVNNVLDKDPPLTVADYLGGAGSANAYPAYDLLGRSAFVGFTAKF